MSRGSLLGGLLASLLSGPMGTATAAARTGHHERLVQSAGSAVRGARPAALVGSVRGSGMTADSNCGSGCEWHGDAMGSSGLVPFTHCRVARLWRVALLGCAPGQDGRWEIELPMCWGWDLGQ